MQAMEMYQTQVSGDNHPTSVAKQLAKMIWRGGQCYAEYAEAFVVKRMIA
jgi:hypothetical protein